MKERKSIIFFVFVCIIVTAAIGMAVYQWEFVAPPEDDPFYQEPIPPLPESISLEVDQPLYYTELPEVENIPIEEYPCDLTPVIEAIAELDKPMDLSLYHITVYNNSYDGTGVEGTIRFIGYNGAREYHASIHDNVLTSVDYNLDE
jgi:hypothetical protein